uniref:pentapeptide repeat-containing protein n=1 Tax=Methylobacterium sp. B34 TaxID=95563 RepID=UPI001955295A
SIYRRMTTASVPPARTGPWSGIRPAAAAVLILLAAGPALADCTEAAQPKVNWRRCSLEGQTLTGVNLGGAMLRDTTFQRATLGQATLADADGYRAKFISASAPAAVFDRARL